ncbi:four helix bundle protein [Kaistella sp.]|uniref:four helix bundle protein n=1 Tax=Kaistella sp. TaxID=2782235 RepID=UPI002F943A2D
MVNFYKEANESFYWIKILYRTNYISDVEFESLKLKIEEIINLLTSIIKSSKLNS